MLVPVIIAYRGRREIKNLAASEKLNSIIGRKDGLLSKLTTAEPFELRVKQDFYRAKRVCFKMK